MQQFLKLDWKIRLLDKLLSSSKPLEQMSLEEVREASIQSISPLMERIYAGKRIVLPEITEQNIMGRHGEISIRLYYPSTGRYLPLIVFFHGGGWVYGNLQTHDRLCRRIARDAKAIVLAVDYRRAPFYKYPTALEDCYDTLCWAIENAIHLKVNPEQVIVMGDSAGGNLATAVCLMARDLGQPAIAQQILIYPVTSGKLDQPSVAQYANAPLLTKERMEYFVQCYARQEAELSQSYFSPLLAEDLSHLPPALIITAEYDLLKEQGQNYGRRLQEANVPVTLIDYPRMVHAFLSFPPFCRAALPAFAQIATFVKALQSNTNVLDQPETAIHRAR